MQVKPKLLISLFCFFQVGCHSGPYALNTTSPRQAYAVHLTERIAPQDPYNNHAIGLKVYSRGQLMVDEPHFTGGDSHWFGDLYPYHSWVADQVLRLGPKKLSADTKYDEIYIRNSAARTIAYLMVKAGSDMFLFFDLQPEATMKVNAPPQTDQRADISWIGYAGQFADGGRLNHSGLNFEIRGKYHSPAGYCVTIKEDDVVVRSRDFEGVSFSDGTEKKFPVAVECGK